VDRDRGGRVRGAVGAELPAANGLADAVL
jgi:hypothetical protein